MRERLNLRHRDHPCTIVSVTFGSGTESARAVRGGDNIVHVLDREGYRFVRRIARLRCLIKASLDFRPRSHARKFSIR